MLRNFLSNFSGHWVLSYIINPKLNRTNQTNKNHDKRKDNTSKESRYRNI